jgi:hypothetical protein
MRTEAGRILEIDQEDLDHLLEEIYLSFWVKVTEQDFRETSTVGELFDKVNLKMDRFASSACLTSVAFFRLRTSLTDLSGLDRRSIRPSTLLNSIVRPNIRRIWWQSIETTLRFRLPELRPGPASIAANCMILSLGAWAYAALLGHWYSWESTIVLAFVSPLLMWWLFRAANQLPRRFPVETFEDLVRAVVRLNQGKLEFECGGSTEKQRWEAFRALLSDSWQIPIALVSRDAQIAEFFNLK